MISGRRTDRADGFSKRFQLRREVPVNWSRVEKTSRDAFGRDAETPLVARPRFVEGVLSLVATFEDVVVWHALFSAVTPRAD